MPSDGPCATRPGSRCRSNSRLTDPSPLERAVGRQLLSRYDDALQQLRESDRELVVARVELGLDYGDIANLSGRPSAAAVRIAVSRALVRLAAEMGHDRRA